MKNLIRRLRILFELCEVPKALRFRFLEPSFNFADFRMCASLRSAGLQPRTVVDVGANIGQFAVGALNAFPEALIFSFEPVPAAYAQLESLAHRSSRRLQVFAMGLGAEEQNARLQVTSQSQSSSFLPLHANHRAAYPHVSQTEEVEVKVTTLDAFSATREFSSSVLLKLDVQGFESRVLEGGVEFLKQVHWIVLETSTRPMYEGELLFDGNYSGL